MISLIQHFEAGFPQKVSLKILKSGIILKTFTHGDTIPTPLHIYKWSKTFCFLYWRAKFKNQPILFDETLVEILHFDIVYEKIYYA